MRNASLELWQTVTHISVGFALIISALFGLAGYATFRALSQGLYVCVFYGGAYRLMVRMGLEAKLSTSEHHLDP